MSAIANKRGQPLAAHCALVALVARQLVLDTYPFATDQQSERQRDILANDVFLASLLHDIGKLDPHMQAYLRAMHAIEGGSTDLADDGEQIELQEDAAGPLKKAQAPFKKFSFETYPRHEEVSWMLVNKFFDARKIQEQLLDTEPAGPFSRMNGIEHAVYWHHAKPLRSKVTKDEGVFASAQGIGRALLSATAEGSPCWLTSGQAQADLQAFLSELQAIFEGSAFERYATALSSAASTSQGADPMFWDASDKTPAFKKAFLDEAMLQSLDKHLEHCLVTEMRRTIVRSCLVGADRFVSAMSREQVLDSLEQHRAGRDVERPPVVDEEAVLPLYAQIRAMEEDFDNKFPGARTQSQTDAAQALAKEALRHKLVCLQGPAGCGKSKIVLQFLAAMSEQEGVARRAFVLVPRTAIGESLFTEMVTEYGVTADVELLTGSKKLFCKAGGTPFDTPDDLQGSASLVITTIDQVSRTLLSHHKIDLMTQLANSHVVFDEAHELFEIPGLALLFLELMRLRKASHGSTLLVSATPNPYMLKELLALRGSSTVSVDTFNKAPVRVVFQALEPGTYASQKHTPHLFADPQKFSPLDKSFVICNTATLAQQAALAHYLGGTGPQKKSPRPVVCFHSKFTPKEKSRLLGQVLRLFGKAPTARRELLISGPIVQASLNVTTANIHTEATHFENWLQRLGRGNRFGTLASCEIRTYFEAGGLDPATKKPTLANKKTLSGVHQTHRTTVFVLWMLNALQESGTASASESVHTLTLSELYRWYAEFHATEEAKAAYIADFKAVLSASAKVFKQNDFDPVQVPSVMRKAAAKKGGRLLKASLRGRSYYVLPMRVTLPADTSKPVHRELLWHDASSDDELMTDALTGAGYSTETENKFYKWTASAGKPQGLSKSLAPSAPGAGLFLDEISKRSKHVKKWSVMRSMALRRDCPVLSAPVYDDDGLYYCAVTASELPTLNLGLASGAVMARVDGLEFESRLG